VELIYRYCLPSAFIPYVKMVCPYEIQKEIVIGEIMLAKISSPW
jgi:hypothetical protein